MGLREDALEAAEAARDARVTAARAVLAGRLAPANVAPLSVADATAQIVVFTDGADLFLAVRDQLQPPVVSRVIGSTGCWTNRGDVASLEGLGLLLATEGESA